MISFLDKMKRLHPDGDRLLNGLNKNYVGHVKVTELTSHSGFRYLEKVAAKCELIKL